MQNNSYFLIHVNNKELKDKLKELGYTVIKPFACSHLDIFDSIEIIDKNTAFEGLYSAFQHETWNEYNRIDCLDDINLFIELTLKNKV